MSRHKYRPTDVSIKQLLRVSEQAREWFLTGHDVQERFFM
jgi:hypothetical protein